MSTIHVTVASIFHGRHDGIVDLADFRLPGSVVQRTMIEGKREGNISLKLLIIEAWNCCVRQWQNTKTNLKTDNYPKPRAGNLAPVLRVRIGTGAAIMIEVN